MLKRWIWILISLTAAAVYWWQFIYPGLEPGVTRLTVMETDRELANLPHYVAADQGYFRAAGLDVTLGTAVNGVLNAEETARADLILTPLDRLLDGGAVAVAGLTHTEPALLLAREKSVPFSWAELKNKTVVGEHPEGTGEIALEHILRDYDMIPQYQYVSIQHLPPHLRSGTYLAGTGEYIILTDPAAARLQKSKQGYIASDLSAVGHIPARVIAVAKKELKQNEDAVKRYTRAIGEAQAWIAAHSAEETAVTAARWFPWMDYQTAVEMVTRARKADLWPANPQVDEAAYNHFMDLLIEAGELPAPIPYDEMVFTPRHGGK